MRKSSLFLFSVQTDAFIDCNATEDAKVNAFYKNHPDILQNDVLCAVDLEILSLPNCAARLVRTDNSDITDIVNILWTFFEKCTWADVDCTVEESKQIVTVERDFVQECIAELTGNQAYCPEKQACVNLAGEIKSLPICGRITRELKQDAEKCVKLSNAASTSVLSAALVLASAVAYLA